MLVVRQSNRLDVLADGLVDALGEGASASVLDADLVVVQSPGMATWLRHRIAEAQGVAAAVEFPLPSSFLWRVIRALVPSVPEQSPFDKRALRWHVYRLLDASEGPLADERAARLARYLADDDTGLKRFQLADRIADVFDQYLVYRPDWLRRWRLGEDLPTLTADEPWQPPLWRALVAAVSEALGPGAATQERATLTERAHAALGEPGGGDALRAAGFPSRIAVFGISAMPPEQLRLLLSLSSQLEVTLYAFNPCRAYWSDIVSETYLTQLEAAERVRDEAAPTHPYHDVGHPLLAELGTAGRHFVDLVLELGEDAVLVDDFVEPETTHALGVLQRDLLELDPGAELVTMAATDHSLQFLDCHGPLRELEVLHDRLLECFADDDTLEPRDVVVMIPDIDRYAPYVEAVFGAEGAGVELPYAISDRGLGRETPVLGTIAALLRLPRARITAADVLGLLETPAVQRACGLSEAELERLSPWVARAGIRWGLDDAHYARFGFEPPAGGHAQSWQAGADRLLLGYAMGEAEEPFRDRLALPGVDGDAAQAVGRLLEFVDRIAAHAAGLAGPQTPGEWRRRITALLADCIDEGDEDTEALNGVREALLEFETRCADAGADAPVSLDVLLAVLEPALTAREGGHRFLGGRVTFCTLMPMRTIPFRIVALLGMNDGDYPRRDVPLDFDLLVRHPRKGDRARRHEDRFLFLEALLAARERLIVAWSGRDPVDDSERPPSVVVSALLDAVDRRFRAADGGAVLEQCLVQHPLQPFSGAYGATPLRTYAALWSLPEALRSAPVARASASHGTLPAPVDGDTALALDALAGFFADPCGRLLRERFGVRFDLSDEELEEDEPFEVLGLDRHRLRDDALSVLRDGADPERWLRRVAASGALPVGGAGRDAVADARALAAAFDERLGPLLRLPRETLLIDLPLAGTPSRRCVGSVSDCTAVARLRLRPGTASDRDLLRSWVSHLALAAQGLGRPSLLADASHLHAFTELDPAAAQAELAALVSLRSQLLSAPAPMLVDSAAAFTRAVLADEDDPLTAARTAWAPNARRPSEQEGERAPVLRLWPVFPGDVAALRADFERLSLAVWRPLLLGHARHPRKPADALVAELASLVAVEPADG